ncbi:MAG: hypothetical protein LBT08_09175 [Synergistaceae bacterium]|jgi:V/A-type H+-transporting ATPase subunit E|nr:hypothetical protein [Synergistaceae bacterium]
MSLAQITEKIESDARAEADRILDASRKQELAIRDETSAEVKRVEDASSARFERERPEIFKRRDIVARLDVNKIRLGAERSLISDVYAEGLGLLGKLDKAEYVAFFERLLKKAAVDGGELLELSRDEKFIDQEWIDKFNSALGSKIKLSPVKGDFSGGFVLRNGRIAINCTWEMLTQAASESMENEVVSRLFSD